MIFEMIHEQVDEYMGNSFNISIVTTISNCNDIDNINNINNIWERDWVMGKYSTDGLNYAKHTCDISDI